MNEQTQNSPANHVQGKLHGEEVTFRWEEVSNTTDIPLLPEFSTPENFGGSCDYYRVNIVHPTTEGVEAYIAECNDVIEALDMTFAEANMFKELWRSAAARTLGKLKAGHNELRGADKVVFFAKRNKVIKYANSSS